MIRKLRLRIDPIIVGGFLFSAIVALGLVLIGQDTVSSLIVGLLVASITIQFDIISRQDAAKEKIIDSLGGVNVEVLPSSKDLSDAKYRLLLGTRNYIYDTELSEPSRLSGSIDSEFRKLLGQRILKDEVTYKYVRVIYNKEQFERILEWLFKYHTHNFYIGYYLPSPEVMPVLNLMIFDRKHFLIGGYYGPSARGDDRNIYFQHDLVAKTMEQYFDYLWSKARLFNEHKSINWDEIHHCGTKMGYTIDELNASILRIAGETNFSEIQTLTE